MGRHSASDAHLIGTPGGVIKVRTVRRLTRKQRGVYVSKRAFDNFIGSPRNLSGSRPSLKEHTTHGEKWTLTPGCKGCIWARRVYHHTKSCKAKKREFLLTKARSEELRAAEADAWKKPASSTEPQSSASRSGSAREEVQPEPVDEQPQPQPDVGDSDMATSTETPDAEATRRIRILTKRSRRPWKRFGTPSGSPCFAVSVLLLLGSSSCRSGGLVARVIVQSLHKANMLIVGRKGGCYIWPTITR